MAIKYDSDVNDKVVSILNESVETLNTGFRNNFLNDFSAFTEVNLFTNQLNKINSSLDSLVDSYENISASVQDNKSQWSTVENEIGIQLDGVSNYDNNTTTYSSNEGSNNGISSSYDKNNKLTSINSGIKVKNDAVSAFISRLSGNSIIAFLKKLHQMKGQTDTISLLTDVTMSGILLSALKKMLGDTSEDIDERSADSDLIQKLLLEKMKANNLDINTEEGKESIEKVVLENINDSKVDESELNKAIYGDKTKIVEMLDGKWVVADTKKDLSKYVSYIEDSGVKQDVDTSKYGDSCLAFSYVHAYDLFTGSKGSAKDAENYAHASAFYDYINDSKSKVLAKIYDEIMSGKPVILQVNGNKEGTVRHFVTVVGFKEGVTDRNDLKEKDLLILDSWDGKVERMDTSSSRFMTSGKDCNKEYSGYRLRILNDDVATV